MKKRQTENKIVIVVRRTRLDELITRFNTEDQARFYIERLGSDFSDYRTEDQIYKQVVREVEDELSRRGRVQIIDRKFVPNFLFGPDDTVVAIGQDGLVANVLKYLNGQLLLGVNPDPRRWEGILLPFTAKDLALVMPEVFARKRAISEVTMAEARLNTGESLMAVNDLFIGPRSHTSARYSIQTGELIETQSSSGIIISTGLGSSGWLRSIITGAQGISSALTGKKRSSADRKTVAWNANHLYFSIREPWPSNSSAAGITFGKVTRAKPLTIKSLMPENGIIFSDGIEADFLQFNSGTEATVTLAERRGYLVT